LGKGRESGNVKRQWGWEKKKRDTLAMRYKMKASTTGLKVQKMQTSPERRQTDRGDSKGLTRRRKDCVTRDHIVATEKSERKLTSSLKLEERGFEKGA